MTKRELIATYEELSDKKEIIIDGIGSNSNKQKLEDAIECLECSDEMMNDYLTVLKLKYPDTYKVIAENGDYRTHPYNRYYVYSVAKSILGETL